MDKILNVLEILAVMIFLIMLYQRFYKRPEIRAVKVKMPTAKQVRRAKKRARRIRKIKRRFRIPYIGRTKIIEYDPKLPCIESMWNEVEPSRKDRRKR